MTNYESRIAHSLRAQHRFDPSVLAARDALCAKQSGNNDRQTSNIISFRNSHFASEFESSKVKIEIAQYGVEAICAE